MKRFKKTFNPNHIKMNRSFSVPEIAETLGVNRLLDSLSPIVTTNSKGDSTNGGIYERSDTFQSGERANQAEIF
jgi:hypothetical protein